MNAVARAAFNNEDGLVKRIQFNFVIPELKVTVLVFLLLLSALGVVYVKDLNRRLFINYHQLQTKTQQLRSDSNKLLLEQSAWGAQARVQVVAQRQLQMKIPPSIEVMMVKV